MMTTAALAVGTRGMGYRTQHFQLLHRGHVITSRQTWCSLFMCRTLSVSGRHGNPNQKRCSNWNSRKLFGMIQPVYVLLRWFHIRARPYHPSRTILEHGRCVSPRFPCQFSWKPKSDPRLQPASSSAHDRVEFSRDTIFALSSGHGKCGVAVIRISGPEASKAFLAMTKMSDLPAAKKVHLQRLFNPVDGETVDKGLAVWFPGPQSFTGEDVGEFHVHGGPAVVSAMHSALDAINGLRHAEPGEFTKRAFLNGKLDLTEVEGLGDLIHAETEAQRRQALRQMEGDLGKLYEAWRWRLVKCVAHVEAFIDFSEDENIEEGVLDQAQAGVTQLMQDIHAHLNDNRCGERLRSGVQVAIIGRPNVGKSSLLNLLCQRPAAIVTPIAGTTRDVIESAVNIGGYPVLLLDTAGLRDTQDMVEQEGVRRARQRAENADLTIVMTEASDIHNCIASSSAGSIGDKFTTFLESRLQETAASTFASTQRSMLPENATLDGTMIQKDSIFVINKSDLVGDEVKDAFVVLESALGQYRNEKGQDERSVCIISCKTGQGMENLLAILRRKVEALCGNPLLGNPSLTQARHRSNLTRCLAALEAFASQEDLVMAAEQLRIALRHLGKITGRVGVEEILDVVFQDFCIGK
ncbi:tRNA modification GTPase GTPBP3, mitochondrial-like [Acanthaster planci]|uniref:tRNA modification GTPase GTPBP3, mitochondrial-like n=1 Tax=Acanthaster planci TaxID=133434 RepID=A0A8B7Y3A7_ACAPL|nr:tRNA modification GTPase GTPBP3, mitochondrial-like [Acanthaster planci]